MRIYASGSRGVTLPVVPCWELFQQEFFAPIACVLLALCQLRWCREAAGRAVSDRSLLHLQASEAWTMKYTHVQGWKPKAANKRDRKDQDVLGDGLCSWDIHFALLMAAESPAVRRYVKSITEAQTCLFHKAIAVMFLSLAQSFTVVSDVYVFTKLQCGFLQVVRPLSTIPPVKNLLHDTC